MRKLVNIKQLAVETGLAVRTIRSLYAGRKISAIKTGHRTLLFSTERVLADLERFTVEAVR